MRRGTDFIAQERQNDDREVEDDASCASDSDYNSCSSDISSHEHQGIFENSITLEEMAASVTFLDSLPLQDEDSADEELLDDVAENLI